jgi:predicted ATPase
VARFTFHDLCQQPLAAADYLKIAHEFHTIMIDQIPVMDYERRDEAKRFIILIDMLYDNAIKLIASAEAEPDALYRASDGFEAAEVRPHRLAPDRDALAGLSRACRRATRSQSGSSEGAGGDLELLRIQRRPPHDRRPAPASSTRNARTSLRRPDLRLETSFAMPARAPARAGLRDLGIEPGDDFARACPPGASRPAEKNSASCGQAAFDPWSAQPGKSLLASAW